MSDAVRFGVPCCTAKSSLNVSDSDAVISPMVMICVTNICPNLCCACIPFDDTQARHRKTPVLVLVVDVVVDYKGVAQTILTTVVALVQPHVHANRAGKCSNAQRLKSNWFAHSVSLSSN